VRERESEGPLEQSRIILSPSLSLFSLSLSMRDTHPRPTHRARGLFFRPHNPAVRVSPTETRSANEGPRKVWDLHLPGLGARALFTAGVGPAKQPRVTVWVWVNTACRVKPMRESRGEGERGGGGEIGPLPRDTHAEENRSIARSRVDKPVVEVRARKEGERTGWGREGEGSRLI